MYSHVFLLYLIYLIGTYFVLLLIHTFFLVDYDFNKLALVLFSELEFADAGALAFLLDSASLYELSNLSSRVS